MTPRALVPVLAVLFASLASSQKLWEGPLEATNFSRFPNYTGAFNVTGRVFVVGLVMSGNRSQLLRLDLNGTDPACTNSSVPGTMSMPGNMSMPDATAAHNASGHTPPMAGNRSQLSDACGIHVHNGTSCGLATEVGHHYWNLTATHADPWGRVRYNSTNGTATGRVLVHTGFGNNRLLGRAVVVHDRNGTPIACALLQKVRVTTTAEPGASTSSERSSTSSAVAGPESTTRAP